MLHLAEYNLNEVEYIIQSLEEKKYDINGRILDSDDVRGERMKRSVCSTAKLMFLIYRDVLKGECPFLFPQKMFHEGTLSSIKDGTKKTLFFCYKSFIDKSLCQKDINELEWDALTGDQHSRKILVCYRIFFRDRNEDIFPFTPFNPNVP